MASRDFTSSPVVVLGWGVAAVSAVIALRHSGYSGPLVVVTDADARPYSPVLTSYYAGGNIERDRCFAWEDLDPASLVDEIYAESPVVSLNPSTHEVLTADGSRLGYRKLLIATGAHPVAPGFPQSGAYRPLFLRTMHDADRLYGALREPRCAHMLVAGTSMVALKALEACLDSGKGVTLQGRSAHILRASAHALVAARFEGLLEQRGVSLRLSSEIAEVNAAQGGDGLVVEYADGGVERYDGAILAQGVKPSIDFVQPGTLAVGSGLIVDEFMRTSDGDVYAAGDVAEALDLSRGERRIVGLWHNAVRQGQCAGKAIAAELSGRRPSAPFAGSLPCNMLHVRDILFASAGSVAEGANRRVEFSEQAGGACLLAYEAFGSEECLVGFNMLTVTGQGAQSTVGEAIGALRQEVMNSFRWIRGRGGECRE